MCSFQWGDWQNQNKCLLLKNNISSDCLRDVISSYLLPSLPLFPSHIPIWEQKLSHGWYSYGSFHGKSRDVVPVVRSEGWTLSLYTLAGGKHLLLNLQCSEMTSEHWAPLWRTVPTPRAWTWRFKRSLVPSTGRTAHLSIDWAQFLSRKRPQPSFHPFICSFFFFDSKHLLNAYHVSSFCPVQEHPYFFQTQSLGWKTRNPAFLL